MKTHKVTQMHLPEKSNITLQLHNTTDYYLPAKLLNFSFKLTVS